MDASIQLQIPDAVRVEAQKGKKLLDAGYAGGTNTGWERAEQLAAQQYIPMYDAMIMRAWFARHYATSRPNYVRWLHATAEQKRDKNRWRGAIAWLIWGADAAYEWILSENVQKKIVDWGKRHGRKGLKDRVRRMRLTS